MKNFLLSVLLLVCVTASAQIPKPKKNTYVNDYAQVLSKADVVKLNKRIFTLEKQKQVQLAIVLVNKIPAAYDIEDFAMLIGKKWHVGKNQRGIVYVAAITQRKQRLEVARKLDSLFTSEKSQTILTAIKPSFKSADYAAGLDILITNIDEAIEAPEGVTAASEPATLAAAKSQTTAAKKDDDNFYFWVGFLSIAGVVLFVIWLARRSRRRRMYYNQQSYNPNYNPGAPGYGNPGYGNPGYGPGYGGYPPGYGQQQNSTMRDMATGAIIGGAVGYGARALQDRLSDNHHHNHHDNQVRPDDTPYRDSSDLPNEPSSWGDWGGGNDSSGGDYSSASDFSDNSWSDSGSSGDSGFSDSDSGSSDSGGTSDW